MKKRVVIVGAGLCGSLLATLLRDDFEVTLVEQGKKKKPLFTDVDCATGELNTSINRAEGLGGTTNYWHNALIELDDDDLVKAGIAPSTMRRYYDKAWQFFLSQGEIDEVHRTANANAKLLASTVSTVGHMILPQTRHNAWKLANEKHPGGEINIVYGHVEKIASDHVQLKTARLDADYVIACAGGLGTPVLLAKSLGEESGFVPGYHDHPMAYVAKVKLRPESVLKQISCTTTKSAEVRAGIVYETGGLKTVIYLRPAIDLRLGSITGSARYILSDLRNDPFSPKKILMLLGNLEAVREAILFKTKLGFRGDNFSVLILGEQTPLKTRGLQLAPGKRPSLNWEVTPEELASYDAGVNKFFAEFADDIVDKRVVPTATWAFRNAAHHSGTANQFVAAQTDIDRPFFSVTNIPNAFVCDGSLLRAAGIANSGLTLVALCYRLAELLRVPSAA